jgi:hypothetical protein
MDYYWPILLMSILAIPYCYIVARAASIGYFHEKLRYHVTIMNVLEEDPNGKRKRA